MQDWCACGSLSALIDANGNKTRWERDAAGRVIREIRADNTTVMHYTYDSLGRLKTVTDPKLQVTTHTYNLDNTLASTVYTNAQIATPSVSFTYDPAYNRVATMVDGTGTTTYTYHPSGVLGAGQVASVDGPLPDDTITYQYDELGRVVTRAINGVAATQQYDSLGRVTSETNVLGTFTYGYEGVTGRLASVQYPNGQTSAYSYLPNAQDHRLQTIHHRYPNTATLSKFDYTYDAVGNTLTWRQQADTTAVVWEYGYDRADQLTAAIKRATDPQGTILKRYYYRYDPAGNRLSEQIDDAVTSWTYDNLNRLVTQTPGGWLKVRGQLDEYANVTINGKPATVSPTNGFDGLAQVGAGTTQFTITASDVTGNTSAKPFEVGTAGTSKVFTFDANGNLTNDGTRTFEWDARNQLVAVNVGTHRSEFTYNGFQRRVAITERENGALVSRQDFVWCGREICEERSSGVTIRRAFTLGEQAAGASRFFAKDHIGTVTDVADSSAALVARYAFDPWGLRTLAAGQDLTTVGFTGHRWQAQGALWLTMYRGYDAERGRWISEDPIKLTGGINMYAYVGSNPVLHVDPLGLQTYECKRPLNIPGCDPENNVRCGPDVRGNLGYHAFLCVPDEKGGWDCGGQGPNGPTDDNWPRNSDDACRLVDSRECFERCSRLFINSPGRPPYAIGPTGTDCQEWRDEVITVCKMACPGRS